MATGEVLFVSCDLEERLTRVGPDAGFMQLFLVGNTLLLAVDKGTELEQPEAERKTLPDGSYESTFRDFDGKGYYRKLRLVDISLFGATAYECPLGAPVGVLPGDEFVITWDFGAFSAA